ncbi:MAG: MarR family transcriptional regulator [Rhodobiaceae bacterium]|nr:MAG: MarR family transcriptional regulator [Rhodobiaceae bacterium]
MTSKTAPNPDSAEAIFMFFNEIGIIGQLSGTMFRRALPEGMTMAQFSVLNHFSRLGGERTPARLAAAFQVTKGAMTNTLQRLEAKGYVTIEIDKADRRRKLVRATEKGLGVCTETITAFAGPLREFGKALGGEDIEAALPFLQKVRKFLDEARNSEDFTNR